MKKQKMKWCIICKGLPPLYIDAESFDEALARARMVDSRYCGGYVVENEKEK